MKITVFGLGYVGCVSAACLAHDGHTVTGVDINPRKVELINAGQAPVSEPGLDALLQAAVTAGSLRATTDGAEAVAASEASLICVGTPSNPNGSLDLEYVTRVCRQIGAALAAHPAYPVVVLRSTVLPGTVEEILIPILEEHSGKKAGRDFGVCMNPEFLREGSAVEDYYHPSYILLGLRDERSEAVMHSVYAAVQAPIVSVPIKTAEMEKYVHNAYHALKVAFANEIGEVCRAHGIDGQQVMEIFCRDRRLNISPAYLRPGFAFGGSCLPKDLRALLHRAKERDLEVPLLGAVLHSNQVQIEQAVALVEAAGGHRVGVLGLSFKAGTDDVRESPVLTLGETLVGRGYEVRVYDEQVAPDRLTGANKAFLERRLPHIAALMQPAPADVITPSDTIVIANGNPAFRTVPALLREGQVLIDLVGLTHDPAGAPPGAAPTTPIRGPYATVTG